MFIQSPLRGRTEIGKVDRDIILITDTPPVGEFLAAVKGDGLEQVFRHSLKPVVHGRFGILCFPALRLKRNNDFSLQSDELKEDMRNYLQEVTKLFSKLILGG